MFSNVASPTDITGDCLPALDHVIYHNPGRVPLAGSFVWPRENNASHSPRLDEVVGFQRP